jgi:hypothetical protein
MLHVVDSGRPLTIPRRSLSRMMRGTDEGQRTN